MLDQRQCWKAVENREDGNFFYGVLTTGIYCRPSCAARRPLRENVRFYASPAEAERVGLRSCLRCRPRVARWGDSALRISQACRFIEERISETLVLKDLAAQSHLSPFYFQRSFKAIVGLSPKQYLDATRLRKLKKFLRDSDDVTEAIFEAGYGSSSRVYERAVGCLGMTPNQYRQGGRNITIAYVIMGTQLGLILIGATDRGLCFLEFGDTRASLVGSLKREYPSARLRVLGRPYAPYFEKWADAVKAYLQRAHHHPALPMNIRAITFQMRLWNHLQSISHDGARPRREELSGIEQIRAVA
jgi:AraC family transcriptional regulator, regulatory protein of adaptative response / methylated-DNA-[protein]-cysteine methyltransferase